MSGTRFTIEVQPRLPEKLKRLAEFADDLCYSWDRSIRALFARLDLELWREVNHNPKVFLRRVSQDALDAAEHDPGYMDAYRRALSGFEVYRNEPIRSALIDKFDPDRDLIAYFCAEYGLHESLPIYSGGLGILAGDHCKAASDLALPFVAVGLLYRQGYFQQRISGDGRQHPQQVPSRFGDLPITPATGAGGMQVEVSVELPGRTLWLRVWRAKVGHVSLYLLDADLERNSDMDRAITYQLYGGDREHRLKQEIVLGIGGVRALQALNLKPTVWHANEGHAAFMILERIRELVAGGLDTNAAMELVAAGTVFTTHTPVAAGHDLFDRRLIETYFKTYLAGMSLELETFLTLGHSEQNSGSFNMTAFALRGSRHHNGVSQVHGGVASRMESYIWPQIPPVDNPMTYVTNGVHVQTFLSPEWVALFDARFGDWRRELVNPRFWDCIEQIPGLRFWSLRQELKATLLTVVRRRLSIQLQRNGVSAAHTLRMLTLVSDPEADVLVLGFARRFATYKRAGLLFSDPDRLARLLGDPDRPVLLLFAGKAHPHDEPGQELIRQIHEFSQQPRFLGKVLLVEDYDMALARRLVSGVDVWVNNPVYPLEASGTSGEKAAINGVINLSVLDGWWAEGYDGENGWAISPHGEHFSPEVRDREEARDLYDLLEHEVIPLYFNRPHASYPAGWVEKSKRSMRTILPRFNAERMLVDYANTLYAPARDQMRCLNAQGAALAIELALWKQQVRSHWQGVAFTGVEGSEPEREIFLGQTLDLGVRLRLNGLQASDVRVECLLGREDRTGEFVTVDNFEMVHGENRTGDEDLYTVSVKPSRTGLSQLRIRAYPWHRGLSHPFEMGAMIWL